MHACETEELLSSYALRVVLHLVSSQRSQPNETEPQTNRTQSFDWSSIGSAIEHNRTGAFLWVPLRSITEPNRTQSTRLIRFCSVEKQNGTQNW